MMYVWIVVEKVRQCAGHGESMDVYTIPGAGPAYEEHTKEHPAFLKMEDGQAYINGLKRSSGLSLLRLEAEAMNLKQEARRYFEEMREAERDAEQKVIHDKIMAGGGYGIVYPVSDTNG